jgi:hypothetical protein
MMLSATIPICFGDLKPIDLRSVFNQYVSCAGRSSGTIGRVREQEIVQATEIELTARTQSTAHHRMLAPARRAAAPRLCGFGPEIRTGDVTAARTKVLRCCNIARSGQGISQAPGRQLLLPTPPFDLPRSFSPKVPKFPFHDKHALLVTRRLFSQSVLITSCFSDLIFHDITPVNRHLRKILVSELTSAKRVEASKYIRMEEAACMLGAVAKEMGRPIEVRTFVNIMSTNILSRMIFNKRFHGSEDQSATSEVYEFMAIIEEMAFCMGAIHLQDTFNFTRNLCGVPHEEN